MRNESPSTIDLLFFGATADAVGEREIEMSIVEGQSLDSIINSLAELYPRLSDQKLLASVNEEYAEFARPLFSGDKVAIFTPVSGG